VLGRQVINSHYLTFYIILVIKSGRMKWAGHVTRTGETRNAYRLLMGKTESDQLEDLDVDGRILLK